MNRPTYPNRGGGNSKPRGNYNNSDNHSNFSRAPPKFNNDNVANNTNTAPMTGSNVVHVAAKDKSQITCFECGVKDHYTNECPKKIVAAPNTTAPAQQQRRVANGRNQNNRNSRFYHMTAVEAQEAPNAMMSMSSS